MQKIRVLLAVGTMGALAMWAGSRWISPRPAPNMYPQVPGELLQLVDLELSSGGDRLTTRVWSSIAAIEDFDFRQRVAMGVTLKLARGNPEKAVQLIDSAPDDPLRHRLISVLCMELSPLPLLAALKDGRLLRYDGDQTAVASGLQLALVMKADTAAARAYVAAGLENPKLLGDYFFPAAAGVLGRNLDPSSVFEIASSIPDLKQRRVFANMAMSAMTANGPARLKDALLASQIPQANRDDALRTYVLSSFATDRAETLRFIWDIRDSRERILAGSTLLNEWFGRDSQSAAKWVENLAVSDLRKELCLLIAKKVKDQGSLEAERWQHEATKS